MNYIFIELDLFKLYKKNFRNFFKDVIIILNLHEKKYWIMKFESVLLFDVIVKFELSNQLKGRLCVMFNPKKTLLEFHLIVLFLFVLINKLLSVNATL